MNIQLLVPLNFYLVTPPILQTNLHLILLLATQLPAPLINHHLVTLGFLKCTRVGCTVLSLLLAGDAQGGVSADVDENRIGDWLRIDRTNVEAEHNNSKRRADIPGLNLLPDQDHNLGLNVGQAAGVGISKACIPHSQA